VKVHFDYIDPNGGRHTRFVGDGEVVATTTRRYLVEVTSSAASEPSPGDRVWVPKRDATPE
jgi:hypothetical protein